VTGAGIAHKSDRGGVALNVGSSAEASLAGARMAALSPQLLVENMVTDGVAEILVGLIVDPQFGQVLVLAAGGTHAELLQDRVSLLPPWTRPSIAAALRKLNIVRLLAGFRGQPAGDVDALIDAVLAIGRYAADHCEVLVEMDVNPLIVRPQGLGVVAVDALISTQEVS
jgi:acetyl-CoA synthetase